MDRKIVMGVAAVAGIGLLLYLRKSGDASAIGGAGTLVGAAAAANNWATQPIVINTKAPPVVADTAAKNPPPAPAPVPAPSSSSGGFSIGGGPTSGPTKPGSGYIGAGGTEINDPAAVGRLNSISTFVKTLDWGTDSKASSAAKLADAAKQYGVGYREIAIASGYREEDVDRLFRDNGQTVSRF